jgi:5-methylcytosine-specific restriction endonuclease McrA
MTTTLKVQKSLYEDQLQDPRWKKLRQIILIRDRHACRSCGSANRLHIHHRQYHRDERTGEWKKPWEYQPVFLVTLCDSCHYEGHQQFAIPLKDV